MSNPVIDSVIVDAAVTQITVSGSGFKPSSSAPSVRFNGSTLTVSSSSDTLFVASLPGGLSTGSYLLEVENSDTFSIVAVFEVYVAQQSSFFIGWCSLSNMIGAITNVTLSTTPVQIPAFGASINSSGIASGSGRLTDFLLSSDQAVPGGATQLQGSIKNVTTSTTLGPVGVNSGNYNGLFSSSLNFSDGDQIVVILEVTGSSTMFPGIRWVVGFGE